METIYVFLLIRFNNTIDNVNRKLQCNLLVYKYYKKVSRIHTNGKYIGNTEFLICMSRVYQDRRHL